MVVTAIWVGGTAIIRGEPGANPGMLEGLILPTLQRFHHHHHPPSQVSAKPTFCVYRSTVPQDLALRLFLLFPLFFSSTPALCQVFVRSMSMLSARFPGVFVLCVHGRAFGY